MHCQEEPHHRAGWNTKAPVVIIVVPSTPQSPSVVALPALEDIMQL